MEDYLEIDESEEKYSIDSLKPGSDEMLNLFHKHLNKYITRSRYWKPRLDVGKRCMNAMRRQVFTPGQRAKYHTVEKKWPIELQLMKKVINTLSDKIEKSIPGTDIVHEDDSPPEYAAKPESVKTVLTWMKQQLGISDKRKKVLRNGLVTGYPVCLWFEKVRGISHAPGLIPLIPSVLSWESVLPEQHFDENKGITDFTFVKKVTTAELYKTFPDRVEEHKKHLAMLKDESRVYMDSLLLTDQTTNATERSEYLYKMISEAVFDTNGGRYSVMQNLFSIAKRQRYWVNPDTFDVFVPPSTWTEQQKQEWLNQHQEFNLSSEDEICTLWTTVIDSTGFVWENKEHWYQEEGELPCVFYIADMIDNVPMGAGEDRLPYVLLASVCATEGLDQVRRGTGRLTAVAEGSIRNMKNLRTELTTSEGVAIVKKNVNPKDAIAQFTRNPNTTFLEMQDRIEEQLESVDGVNDAMTGATNPRQSEKAKRMELQQGLSPSSPYINNYATFALKLENLLCKMIPRVMTEEMIIEIKDEYGQAKEPLVVNKTEFDYSGEAKRIANDIVSPRYRAVATIGDDSMTSRESQLIEFMELLEAIGNQLFQLDPILLGQSLSIFPNMFAREASKFMIEYGMKNQEQQGQAAMAEAQTEQQKQDQRREIEMEKIKRPRISIKLDAKDVQEAPAGAKVLYQAMKNYEADYTNQQAIKNQQQSQLPIEEQEQVPVEAV